MSLAFYRISTEKLSAADVPACIRGRLLNALGLARWKVRVCILPFDLPDAKAVIDFSNTGGRTAVVWIEQRWWKNHEILAHEFAHLAIFEMKLELPHADEEKLAWKLGRMALATIRRDER